MSLNFQVFRLVGARHLWEKRGRSVLMTVGIALGVSLFTGIEMINSTTIKTFRENANSLAGEAALTVTAGATGFPEEKLEEVRAIAGVKYASPMVESRAFAPAVDGRASESLQVLGIDLLSEGAVRSYRTDDGRDIIQDPLVFLNQADSLILTRDFARERGLKIDDKITLMTALGARDFTVRGLLSPEGPAKAYGGGLAIMDIDGARVTFAKVGRTDRVDVVPREGVDAARLAAQIAAALGPGYQVETPSEQSRGMERLVNAYQGLLSFVSLLALFVGIILVSNAIAVSVSERRRDFGILRALGATKFGILGLVVLESAVLGLLGSLAGLFAGRAFAASLTDIVSQGMSTQYATAIQVGEVAFEPGHVWRALAAGALAATLAGLWPAWLATRVLPIEAIKSPAESGAAIETRGLWLRRVGVVMLALIGLDSLVGLSARFEWFKALAPALITFGALFSGPWFVWTALRLLKRVVDSPRQSGARFLFLLAIDNLLRNPKRTGTNVMTLVIGLMLVVIIAIMNVSLKTSLVGWFQKVLRADLVVSSPGRIVALQVQLLDESIGAEIQAVPGVDVTDGIGVTAWRFVKLPYRGRRIDLKAYDRPHPKLEYSPFDVVGGDPRELGPRLYAQAEPGVFVTESFGKAFGTKIGDVLTLASPTGNVDFRVLAFVVERASTEVGVFLSRDLYKRHWQDPLVTSFFAQAAPGVDVESLRREIDARVGQSRGVTTLSNAALRADLGRLIDENVAYTRAIEFAALIIGLLGVMNTLLVSLLERSRELGMMRAVGVSARQLKRLIATEALLQGAIGGLVATLLGTYVSYTWVVGNLSEMMGWSVDFRFPVARILFALAAGLFIGWLGGWIPARRASKRVISESLGYE